MVFSLTYMDVIMGDTWNVFIMVKVNYESIFFILLIEAFIFGILEEN